MKFKKGDIVYRWSGGDSYNDGMRMEVIAYDQRIAGLFYLCDNLSSDKPRFHDEESLVTEAEWTVLVERMLTGDLQSCDCASKLQDNDFDAFLGWKHINHRKPRYSKDQS